MSGENTGFEALGELADQRRKKQALRWNQFSAAIGAVTVIGLAAMGVQAWMIASNQERLEELSAAETQLTHDIEALEKKKLALEADIGKIGQLVAAGRSRADIQRVAQAPEEQRAAYLQEFDDQTQQIEVLQPQDTKPASVVYYYEKARDEGRVTDALESLNVDVTVYQTASDKKDRVTNALYVGKGVDRAEWQVIATALIRADVDIRAVGSLEALLEDESGTAVTADGEPRTEMHALSSPDTTAQCPVPARISDIKTARPPSDGGLIQCFTSLGEPRPWTAELLQLRSPVAETRDAARLALNEAPWREVAKTSKDLIESGAPYASGRTPLTKPQRYEVSPYASGPCGRDGRVAFHCPVRNGKRVTLCRVGAGTPGLEYRFGTATDITLRLPNKGDSPKVQARDNTVVATFANQGHRYQVQGQIRPDPGEPGFSGVRVFKGDVEIDRLECSAAPTLDPRLLLPRGRD